MHFETKEKKVVINVPEVEDFGTQLLCQPLVPNVI